MTPETTVFVWTIVLGLVHLFAPAPVVLSRVGLAGLAGPRDNMPDIDSLYLGRAERANENFKETLPWALGLLILVQVTGDANATTAAGAWIYLVARVAYLPLYLFGVPWLRTGAWATSLAGLAMLLFPLLG